MGRLEHNLPGRKVNKLLAMSTVALLGLEGTGGSSVGSASVDMMAAPKTGIIQPDITTSRARVESQPASANIDQMPLQQTSCGVKD